MKILIGSDIHGDAEACRALLHTAETEGAERLVLLGDLLYHGPRNDLPPAYAPKQVIDMLNHSPLRPLCVRGNCEAEVDAMVLSFPVMADYAFLEWDGIRIFATHGHLFSPEHLPPLCAGEVFLSGHTHIPMAETDAQGILCLNPGSAALPKGGWPRSYMLYENREFTVRCLEDGRVLCRAALPPDPEKQISSEE